MALVAHSTLVGRGGERGRGRERREGGEGEREREGRGREVHVPYYAGFSYHSYIIIHPN